jgi:hypothetical protein
VKKRPFIKPENILKSNLKELNKMESRFEQEEKLRQAAKDIDIKELYKKNQYKPS